MSIAQRFASILYALSLRAFPRAHRAQFGTEMMDVFEREVGERARNGGPWASARFTLAACLNLISEGFGERRRRSVSGAERHRPIVFGAIGRDLAHAVRSLLKARAFTLVCVLSLGVGIGTVMAIITVMRQLTAAPPDVKTDGFVEFVVRPIGPLRARVGGAVLERWSYPDFEEVRDGNTGVAITGWALRDVVLRQPDGQSATREDAMYVSPNYFTAVGIALARGAGFERSNKDGAGGAPSVIVGYRLWQNRLGSDPEIVGKSITINGVPHLVVGIAPSGFTSHLGRMESSDAQLWIPLDFHPRVQADAKSRSNRDVDWVRVIGRLPSGTSLSDANGAVAAIMSRLAHEHPTSNEFKSASVEPYFPLGAKVAPIAARAQGVVIGLSGMVLLVVCLNISGMVVVRSAMRERELAVRLAIGASRGRLMQYLLSEAFVMAALGGTLAVLVLFLVPAALAWLSGGDSAQSARAFQPDGVMLAIGLGLCFATSLLFGLFPAYRFSRPSLVVALKDEAGGGGRRVGRSQRWTAATQAAIAIPFLVLGGVRLDQVRTTAAADLGFDPKGLFAAPLDVAGDGITSADADFRLQSVQEHLRQANGIVSVTVADGLPLGFQQDGASVSREGEPALIRVPATRVGERYLETMRIPLLRGRSIGREDRTGAEPVVVLSEPLAAQLFPNREALGGRLTFAMEGGTAQILTVIGVTADLVSSQMGERREQMFVPLAQHPTSRVMVIARAAAARTSMAGAFKNAFALFDPDFVDTSLITGEWLVKRSMDDLLQQAMVSGVAAVVALLLAALGVYGVVAFMVTTRTREIGVRVALGATRGRVLATVLLQTAKLVLPGVIVGLSLAVLWVRVVDPSWYALGGVEPLIYTVAAAATLAVALLAGLPSARRAASLDPIQAIRADS